MRDGRLGLRHELAMKLRRSFLSHKTLSKLAKAATGQTHFPYDLAKPPLNKVALEP